MPNFRILASFEVVWYKKVLFDMFLVLVVKMLFGIFLKLVSFKLIF